ncbi:MAG: primosomal replication protein N [Methylophilaceae bacterium]
MNKVVLSGQVIHCEPLRYTPAGLPLLSFLIHHVSENSEAGLKRKVECEIRAIAMGELAKSHIQTGANINVTGFLAKRSAKSTQLVLHIQELRIMRS